MNEKELKAQLSFIPKLEGGLSRAKIAEFDNVIVGGMGGSGLAARILFFLDPTFPAWLHDDYHLPIKSEGKTLYVAVSYSGNTAETLSFVKEALEKQYPLVAITSVPFSCNHFRWSSFRLGGQKDSTTCSYPFRFRTQECRAYDVKSPSLYY